MAIKLHLNAQIFFYIPTGVMPINGTIVLLLLARVGNMRQSSLVEAHVRAILISKKVTKEGEVMPYAQTELTVSG